MINVLRIETPIVITTRILECVWQVGLPHLMFKFDRKPDMRLHRYLRIIPLLFGCCVAETNFSVLN